MRSTREQLAVVLVALASISAFAADSGAPLPRAKDFSRVSGAHSLS
jgi:hypothetical protein